MIGTLHREEEIKTEITVPEYLLSKSIETLLKVHPYEEPVWNIVNLDNTNPVTGFGIIGELAEPADIYITGDYKYHDFFQAENRLILTDIGHYESEQFTKEIFYELVTKKISNFAIQFSKVETNPIHYL